MDPNETKFAVRQWAKIRTNADDAYSYLNQGQCFSILPRHYNTWKTKDPDYVHVYMGIFEKELKLILVDSVTDSTEEDSKFIFIADYLEGLDLKEFDFVENEKDGDISFFNALKDKLRWDLFNKGWISSEVNSKSGLFQIFNIPFSDLIAIFDQDKAIQCTAVLGITKNRVANLILFDTEAGTGMSNAYVSVEDLSTPVPPYSDDFPESDYGLLG